MAHKIGEVGRMTRVELSAEYWGAIGVQYGAAGCGWLQMTTASEQLYQHAEAVE